MALRRTKPRLSHIPKDQRIEIFSYSDIAHQTGFSPHLLRKIARRMGVEQTVFMRDSLGGQVLRSKRTGVRARNIGRIIKGAAAELGKGTVQNFEREMMSTLDSNLYRGFKSESKPPPLDPYTASQLDELERKLGLK